MSLGKNIRTIRKSWRLKQEEFGELMQVSRGSISVYEIDNSTPSIEFLLRLQVLTGINAHTIFYGDISKESIPTLSSLDVPTSDNTLITSNIVAEDAIKYEGKEDLFGALSNKIYKMEENIAELQKKLAKTEKELAVLQKKVG